MMFPVLLLSCFVVAFRIMCNKAPKMTLLEGTLILKANFLRPA
jgi:hypothetical protein